MTQTVNFRKDGNKIKLHFMYNTDLVDIMRSHKGYFFRADKSWVFPEAKRTDLYDELTSKGYNVHYLTPMSKAPVQIPLKHEEKEFDKDHPDYGDAFMVAGHCKKCNKWGFLFRDGLCGECK